MVKEKKRMTPEEVNKIIHKFLGNCLHENYTLTSAKESITGNLYDCPDCGRRTSYKSQMFVFPDYYNSLDLLRPAEIKIFEKFGAMGISNCMGLTNSNAYDKKLKQLCAAEKFLLTYAPASIRARALAEVIGGITNGE